MGTNRLFNGSPADLSLMAGEALKREREPHQPHLPDGQATERIAEVKLEHPRSPLLAINPGARIQRLIAD